MSCPARPQYCWLRPVGRAHHWRAEHAAEYMSSTKGRERRLRTFSTLPQWKLV